MIYQYTNTAQQLEKEAQRAPSLRSWYEIEPDKTFEQSFNLISAEKDARYLKTPIIRLLNDLVVVLSKHQRQPRQIECYLYSPHNQVHVFSLNIEHLHPIVRQKDLLMKLVLTRLYQLKLVFPINRIEVNCDQSCLTNTQVIQ